MAHAARPPSHKPTRSPLLLGVGLLAIAGARVTANTDGSCRASTGAQHLRVTGAWQHVQADTVQGQGAAD